MNLLYIGSGPISNFHIPTLLAAGFSIKRVATTTNSDRCLRFCEKHHLVDAYEKAGYKHCITNENFDCAVIAIDTKATPQVLQELLPLNIPIMIEKPGAWHPQQLINLTELYPNYIDNVFVAYNRRYYEVVRRFKDFISNNKQGILKLSIPDSINSLRQLLVNGCHMLDLINHLSPGIKIHYKKCIYDSSNNIISLVAAGESSNEWQVLIDSNPMSPDNFEISASCNETLYKLRPIEILEVFNQMDIIPPTKEIPIRRYVPKSKGKFIENPDFKPGFLEQSKAFMSFCKDRDSPECHSRIQDAIETLKLSHSLINDSNMTYNDYINL